MSKLKQKPPPIERCILANIDYYATLAGIDKKQALMLTDSTLRRREKNPECLTVGELLSFSEAANISLEKLFERR